MINGRYIVVASGDYNYITINDVSKETESFETFEVAQQRAEKEAEAKPGDPIFIFKKIATTLIPTGKVETTKETDE